MNYNMQYLINPRDYLAHIHDKTLLYAMLRDLVTQIMHLPMEQGTKTLKDAAAAYGATAGELFDRWGIPKSYLVTHDNYELLELFDRELTAPSWAAGSSAPDNGEPDGLHDDGDELYAVPPELRADCTAAKPTTKYGMSMNDLPRVLDEIEEIVAELRDMYRLGELDYGEA